MVFPVVMYGCESWTVMKAERRRIGAFELWCCPNNSFPSLLACGAVSRVSLGSVTKLAEEIMLLKFFYQMAAAAAAKSLQLCPTLWDPIDGSPPGSPVPGILQGTENTGVGCHFFL